VGRVEGPWRQALPGDDHKNMTTRTRVRVALVSAAAVAMTTLTATGNAATRPRPSPVDVGSAVYVDVAVATLWVSPSAPRTIDAPALADPVRIRAWLRAMSTDARRGLVGRVETQALYGASLLVTGVQSRWLHVVAVGQSTHRDSRGYPGWVPRRQVTTRAPIPTDSIATVTRVTTRLHRDDGRRALTVSFGTRLPVIGTTDTDVRVTTPDGAARVVPRRAVVVRPADARALPATVRATLDSARSFAGVPYLWGGRSGFAVDCSGFTGLVLAVHGVRAPRDADDQARGGRAVATGDRRPGDLAFFGHDGAVTHVGFVVGSDRLLQAPASGQVVSTTSMSNMSGLMAVRRYL